MLAIKCQVSLVVILFIAIGLPALHPLFHPHADCDHTSPAHASEQVRAGAHTDRFHECPLCGFLATHQLHVARTHFAIAGDEKVDPLTAATRPFTIKRCALPVEARAPPLSPFTA
jgi:hypothetical protein